MKIILIVRLSPTKKKFEQRLSASSSAIDTLTNLFVSRDSELKLLHEFLLDSNRNLAIIKGEAGIGKTRLVVEFFKRTVDVTSEWIALCINQYNIDFEKLRFSLSNGKRYVVLVDDAQNFTSQQLADLHSLTVQNSSGAVKVIFAVRGLASYEALRLINSFDKKNAVILPLDKLSKEDTKKNI